MDFDTAFNLLDRRARGISIFSAYAGGAAILLFFLAKAFWPGPFGGVIRFIDISIPNNLEIYFDNLGLPTRLVRDRLVLGIPLAAFDAAFHLIMTLVGVAAAGSLLRLQWRWALGAAAILAVLCLIELVSRTHEGYRVADLHEFGVLQPEANKVVLAPSLGPRFHEVNEKPGEDPGAWSRRWQDNRNAERQQRIIQIRPLLLNPQPDMTPAQAAGMHFVGAEVAYLEEDLPATIFQLNAIPNQTFDGSWSDDYRLRIVREWVEGRHGTISRNAYAPKSGMDFATSRFISESFCSAGWIAFLFALGLVELSRYLRRKIKRLRCMAEGLQNPNRNPSTPAFSPSFGKRQTDPWFGLV